MIVDSFDLWISRMNFLKRMMGVMGGVISINIIPFFSGGDIFYLNLKNNERGTPAQFFAKS